MSPTPGYLVISLDFELHWGMFDAVTRAEYGAHYDGVHEVVPKLLTLFHKHKIHATWATVGMLMHENRSDLLAALPPQAAQPQYIRAGLSAYEHLKESDMTETDPHYFAPALVRAILATPGQELASHTYSHFYAKRCRKGSAAATFAADCQKQRKMFAHYGATPTSLVFPRNQATEESLQIAKTEGITAYRGNENNFLYRDGTEQTLPVRALRLLDAYLNLTGHHTNGLHGSQEDRPVNIPSSRFLRPWSKRFKSFEPLRLRRIKRAMAHAAKRGEVFHLWWHPHNMGVDQTENLAVLEELFTHFESLKVQYGMESRTMAELTAQLTDHTTEPESV